MSKRKKALPSSGERDAVGSRAIKSSAVRRAPAGTRLIHVGQRARLFTVGYEQRDGRELMDLLQQYKIRRLVDVRASAKSHKPDFRQGPLSRFCEEAGIEYQHHPTLGATDAQRDAVKQSGFASVAARYRAHAIRTMGDELNQLARDVQKKRSALLCYERAHEDCHRSVVAELLVERNDITVLAID